MKDIDHIASLIGKSLFYRMNFINELYDKINNNWYQMLDSLPDYDLIFFYSKLPDEAHHLLSHILEYDKIIEFIYNKLCNLPMLFDLKDVAILILSDHGFSHSFTNLGKEIYGTHSNTGFWSTNVETNIKPRVVFDFYDLIYELVVYK
jgi:2,3-bisphosphoglycerate-independent phosphoglycerate mutase